MTNLKDELKQALYHELKELRFPFTDGTLGETYFIVKCGDIVSNENLLQELENVLHSKIKLDMDKLSELKERYYEADKKVSELGTLLDSAKTDLRQMDLEVERVKKRNKVLSDLNRELRNAENVVLREIKNCPHHEIKKDKFGVRAVSTIRMKQTKTKEYTLVCTKCNQRF